MQHGERRLVEVVTVSMHQVEDALISSVLGEFNAGFECIPEFFWIVIFEKRDKLVEQALRLVVVSVAIEPIFANNAE